MAPHWSHGPLLAYGLLGPLLASRLHNYSPGFWPLAAVGFWAPWPLANFQVLQLPLASGPVAAHWLLAPLMASGFLVLMAPSLPCFLSPPRWHPGYLVLLGPMLASYSLPGPLWAFAGFLPPCSLPGLLLAPWLHSLLAPWPITGSVTHWWTPWPLASSLAHCWLHSSLTGP